MPFTAIRCPDISAVSRACATLGFITTPENDSDEILIQVLMFGSNCLGDNCIDSFSVRWILSLNLVSSKNGGKSTRSECNRLRFPSTFLCNRTQTGRENAARPEKRRPTQPTGRFQSD
jgi:hypothetical protein